MNSDLMWRFALDRQQGLLREAVQQVCCPPKKIKVALPKVVLPVPTTCLTC